MVLTRVLQNLFNFNHIFLSCRSETATWFVCGRWLENAWSSTPPPSAPSPTASGSVGSSRGERSASWSRATTRSLIFPPYRRPHAEMWGCCGGRPPNSTLHQKKKWLKYTCNMVAHPPPPPISLTELHYWWCSSLRKMHFLFLSSATYRIFLQWRKVMCSPVKFA